MPEYFFDSNIIVKRYRQEKGSGWVRAICEGHHRPIIYISQIAEVEVAAAIRRAGKLQGVHPAAMDAPINIFERHFTMSVGARRRSPPYRVIPLQQTITTYAALLCNQFWNATPHTLRSLDAIQLASALFVAASSKETLLLVTADRRLSVLAPLAGLQVINPELM